MAYSIFSTRPLVIFDILFISLTSHKLDTEGAFIDKTHGFFVLLCTLRTCNRMRTPKL